MNTTNTGSHEPGAPPAPTLPKRRGMGVILLVMLIASFALALHVALNVIGVLYNIVFPPSPPLPTGVQQLSHTSPAYGVDEWQYSTAQDGCSLTRYYTEQGGKCTFAPQICDGGFVPLDEIQAGQNVSRCTAEQSFSIFALKWEAIIASGYQGDQPTRFKLMREIFWTGEVPPPMFAPMSTPTTASP